MNTKKLNQNWVLLLADAKTIDPLQASGEQVSIADTVAKGVADTVAKGSADTVARASEPSLLAGAIAVTLPGTVVGHLLQGGLISDPYFDTNMEQIPGFKFARRGVYANLPKPPASPFRKPWWYRTTFLLPEKEKEKHYWLRFDGINDSANVWLNGKRVGSPQTLKGAYSRNEIDITRKIQTGENILAVEVFSPQVDDFSIPFMDWNPVPSDDSMGIWQGVYLCESGMIRMRHTFVRSILDEGFNNADLIIETHLQNTTSEKKQVTLSGTIECSADPDGRSRGQFVEVYAFEWETSLDAYQTKVVTLTPEELPQLRIQDPKLWWPHQWGEAHRYSLHLQCFERANEGLANTDGRYRDQNVAKGRGVKFYAPTQSVVKSDEETVVFGIREITGFKNNEKNLQIKVNGKNILIRGAAWTPDLLLRQSDSQDSIDVQWVKNLNFNAIRMEGKLASDRFWDICDEEGILVLAGWDCCGFWEKWADWKDGDLEIACHSLESQIYRLRNHPSLALWFYGSDFPPTEPVEKAYLEILHRIDSSLLHVSSAAHKSAPLTGMPGVKMTGPYGYVPPNYWYNEQMEGKAEGFNTETGPDVCIPVIETIRKMFKPESQFVGSFAWDFHAGLNDFQNTREVDKAIAARYGVLGPISLPVLGPIPWPVLGPIPCPVPCASLPSRGVKFYAPTFNTDTQGSSLEEYVKTAQVLGYECWRAMFEAHLRNYPKATGVIGWMLNSAWPSMIWQLYDVYNQPNGAFYGSKEGCKLLHIFYSYDRHEIYLANTTLIDESGLEAQVRVFDSQMTELFEQQETAISLSKYQVRKWVTLPEKLYTHEPATVSAITKLWVSLCLKKEGKLIDSNVYWLSFPMDTFAPFDPKEWYHRPLTKASDLRWVRALQPAVVQWNASISMDDKKIRILIKNISKVPAFFLQFKLKTKEGESITPVFWDDNAITLFPGEERQIEGFFGLYPGQGHVLSKDRTVCDPREMYVHIDGGNVQAEILATVSN